MPNHDAQLDMGFDTNVDGTPDVEVIANANRVYVELIQTFKAKT